MSGWIDLQVNGFAGVDFNADEIDDESIVAAVDAMRSDGVSKCLVTLITAPWETMLRRIDHWNRRLERLPEIGDVVAGLHIEGPFISPITGFVGAHPVDDVIPATRELAARLLDTGQGNIRMITCAPEQDAGAEATRWLSSQGILVAAGHTDASLDQLKQSLDNGLRMFTHLGNGCPATLGRHDNIIQRVLSLSERLAISFIADGHHVPMFALQNYLKRVPHDNIVIVSDAIGAAGCGTGEYTLSGQTVHVDDDLAAWSEDRTHFAGCATTMGQMANLLTDRHGISNAQCDAWMRRNPERLLRERVC